jgi:hypothetical protein
MCKYTLENTAGTTKNGQCRKTGSIGYTRRRKTTTYNCKADVWTQMGIEFVQVIKE